MIHLTCVTAKRYNLTTVQLSTCHLPLPKAGGHRPPLRLGFGVGPHIPGRLGGYATQLLVGQRRAYKFCHVLDCGELGMKQSPRGAMSDMATDEQNVIYSRAEGGCSEE